MLDLHIPTPWSWLWRRAWWRPWARPCSSPQHTRYQSHPCQGPGPPELRNWSVDFNLMYFVADSPCRASQTVLLRGETCWPAKYKLSFVSALASNMISTIVTLIVFIHYHHHSQHNFVRKYFGVFQERRSDNMKYDFWSFGTLESFIDQQSTIYVLLYSCFPLIGVFLPCCSATQHWRTMRYKTCCRAKVLRAFSRPQWILTESALHSWTQEEEEEVEIAEWMF